MTRPVRPLRVASGDNLLPWVILGTAALFATTATCLWAGVRLAALATAQPGPLPGWNLTALLDLVRHGPAWAPELTTRALMFAGGLFVLVCVPVGWVVIRWFNRPRSDAPARSLARPGDIDLLRVATLRQSVAGLRPSLAPTRPAIREVRDLGAALGTVRGTPVAASWEDTIVAVMAPRSGKTTCLGIPMVLDAPGPVIATSNKADLWAATASLRQDHGSTWLFDPQGIIGDGQGCWWNPVERLDDVERAFKFARHFVDRAAAERGGEEIWAKAATNVLAALMVAAHCKRGSLLDVFHWVMYDRDTAPVTILREHGHARAADLLASHQTMAPETRTSVYFNARAGVLSLTSDSVARWVTPQPGLPQLRADEFVTSRDTLYLLSKEGGGTAAPILAALADEFMGTAADQALRQPGHRLDPPLLMMLDEAANVCPIADLPAQYSHFGSRGVVPVTVLQSYAQGRKVWGELGMKALWQAATVKLVGAGADDPAFAEDLSRLIGEHTVDATSVTSGRQQRSVSTATRQQRIMTAAQVRELPKNSAILLATGAKPALLQMRPWYRGNRAARIASAIDEAGRRLTARAAGEATHE